MGMAILGSVSLPGTSRGSRKSGLRLLVVVAGLSGVLIYGLLGVATGVTVDNDAGALLDAFRSLINGSYRPSRTSGYPLYEFLGSGVFALGGVRAVMLLSLLFTLVSLVLLLIPTRALRQTSGLLAWLGLAITPVVMTNASAVMETSLVLLVITGLTLTLSYESTSTLKRPLLLGSSALVLVLTRADALLLGIATAGALAFWGVSIRASPAWFVRNLGAIGGGLALGMIVLIALTNRLPFSSAYIPDSSATERILRAGVGVFTLFGPLGPMLLSIVVVALLVVMWRSRQPTPSDISAAPLDSAAFTSSWAFLTLALYGLRFASLPDELEYLLPVLVVLAASAAGLVAANKWVGYLVIAQIWTSTLTGLATVSFLDRTDPWQARPIFSPSLQQGAWSQDLQLRQAANVRSSAQYQEFLDNSLGKPLVQDVDAGRATVMPSDSWNYVLNPGYTRYYDAFEFIIGCDQLSSETLIPGWRISQPAGSFTDLDQFASGQLMTCEPVAKLVGSTLVPVNSGAQGALQSQYERP